MHTYTHANRLHIFTHLFISDKMLVSTSFDQNLVVWDVANSVQKFSLKVYSHCVHHGEIVKRRDSKEELSYALVVNPLIYIFVFFFMNYSRVTMVG